MVTGSIDSSKIRKILTKLFRAGIEVSLSNGKLTTSSSKNALNGSLVNLIKENKSDLIAFLIAENKKRTSGTKLKIKKKTSRSGNLPTSSGQQRLWFIDQFQGSSAEYNISMAFKVTGEFDTLAVEESIRRVIARHEVLRTVYAESEEGPIQVIRENFDFTLTHQDLSKYNKIEQLSKIKEQISKEQDRVFDLSSDLMMRALYLQLSAKDAEQSGVLIFTVHHIAADGWSMAVLVKEFIAQYQAILKGESDPLEALEIQYVDYADWQNEWLASDEYSQQLNYWKSQLSEIPLVHSLPLNHSQQKVNTHQSNVVKGYLNAEVAGQLDRLSRANGMTLFMLLHAGLGLVLSKHSNSQDIVIGTPVANRTQVELTPLIGFFVNTLVLRTNTDHDNLKEYLAHIRRINLEAQTHQDIPFEQLVEYCNVPRNTRHAPIFQIMFSMDTNEQSELTIPGVSFAPLDSSEITAKFDIDISAQVTENGIHFSWIYDTSLFSQAYIETLSEHLNRLLEGMLAAPAGKLSDLPMLSAQEIHYLTHELNDRQVDYPQDKLIHELFEKQAKSNPNNIAVVFEDKQITYQELNEASNQLAHYLREQGIATETLVGICFERSLEMVISILAILKAGGAYVPLDPNYPEARLNYMLEDTGLKYLLTQSEITGTFSAVDNVQLFTLDSDSFFQSLQSYSKDNLALSEDQNSSNLAYVIYTSGSTGKPKGVMVEHGHWDAYQASIHSIYQLVETDKVLQFSSVSFDIFVEEFSASLLNGACLHMVNSTMVPSAEDFWQNIRSNEITIVSLPTAYCHYLGGDSNFLSELDTTSLRLLITGGESLSINFINKWQKAINQDIRLLNTYGPTEATVISTSYEVAQNKRYSAPVPIGRALDNSKILVLSQSHQLVPYNCIGELYLGGLSLARGYLNQLELTKERFIKNPFSDNPNDRLYKTGDLVRYLSDGNLEFIGRIDDQVKIRGFRIELGEIENQLSQNDDVAASFMLVREDEPEEKRLVAYVVAKETEVLDEATFIHSLREDLQTTLPDYMLPFAFVILEQLVLTPNGKVDKKALPAPDGSYNQGEYIAPKNDTEKNLVKIWAKLLKLDAETISVTANFFALGGHSLLAVRLVSEIRTQLQQELAIKVIFESSSIQTLALQIDSKFNAPLRKMITKVSHLADEPIISSFAQQRLWFIDQLQGGSVEYNMPAALNIDGDFDVDAAEQAITRIIQRHESLRTIFKSQGEQTLQVIQTAFDFILTRHNLTHLDEKSQLKEVNALVTVDRLKTFNLSQDLMVRVSYIQLGTEENSAKDMLLFNMHHIASDGWSMGVLLKEFVTQYQAIMQGEADPLPPLSIQYSDYAHWQTEYLVGEVLDTQLNYWTKQLEDAPAVHSLSLDYPRPEVQTHQGAVVESQLNANLAQRLKQVANEHQLTPFMLLHGALALVLSRHSNSQDIVIGTPVANRMQAELEPLIGFFINTLVLRADTHHENLTDYFAHIRKVNLDAQAYQDIPFEQLVEHCNVSRSTQHAPLFQIMFSMNTNEQSQLTIPGVSFTPIEYSEVVAKFDLEISAQVTESGIYFSWVYDTSIFSQANIDKLSERLNHLLVGMIEVPTGKLSDLSMLSAQEIHYLTHELNDTQVDYPQDKLIHELFEAQAKSNPNNIAVVFEDKQMTYQELNEASNRLAYYLREQGVKTETLVGICVERSLEMIIGILAIFKAGAAYVPLDPDHPEARLNYVLEDTGLNYLLTQSGMTETFSVAGGVQIIQLDSDSFIQSLQRYGKEDLELSGNQKSSGLAYVIYTSGSTGKPKGVMVEQSALVNLISAMQDKLSHVFSAPSKLLAVTTIAFDIAGLELFGPLCHGGQMVLASKECAIDPSRIDHLLEQHNIQSMQATPATWQLLVNSNWSGKKDLVILSGGEALSNDLAGHLLTLGQQVWNCYGPTEACIWSLVKAIKTPELAAGAVLLGDPLNNYSHYVLNESQQLVPIGCEGELYIGGIGLARGYLNNDKLTKEIFICNPFSDESQERLYKTGDLVRYMEDGNLEFIGRIDDQVKIRGFRIELGEIENQLSQNEDVAASLVVVREDEAGEKRLVAYVVAKETEVMDEAIYINLLRENLQQILPGYMLPSAFVILEQFPLTPNGKIDKKALPAPDSTNSQSEYIAPTNDIENTLVMLWAQMLQLDAKSISITANFFELGGHSLLVVKLINLVNEHWEIECSLKEIFDGQTIFNQSVLIKDELLLQQSLLNNEEKDSYLEDERWEI